MTDRREIDTNFFTPEAIADPIPCMTSYDRKGRSCGTRRCTAGTCSVSPR